MDHQSQEAIERDVPNAEGNRECRDAFVECAPARQSDSRKHRHGCGFASDFDCEAPWVFGTGVCKLLRRDQRKQIVRFAVGVELLANRVVNRAEVNDDSGFHITEGNAK